MASASVDAEGELTQGEPQPESRQVADSTSSDTILPPEPSGHCEVDESVVASRGGHL